MTHHVIQCKAIIFDVDGVLIDSTAVVERHWFRFARKHGLDPERVILTAHGRPTVEAMRLLTPHLNVTEEAEQLVRRAAHDKEGLKQMDGVKTLIDSLPEGVWAVATSGSRETASFRLKFAGIPLPGVLVTSDDVDRGKPDPEAYLQASQKLGIPPDKCIVFEDSPAGIAAGREAGMRVIAVTTTHRLADVRDANFITQDLSHIRVIPDNKDLAVRIAEVSH